MHSAGVRWSSDTIHLSSSLRQHSISDNGRSREPLYGGSDEGYYPAAWQAWPPDPDLLTSLLLISGTGMPVRSSSGGILPPLWLS